VTVFRIWHWFGYTGYLKKRWESALLKGSQAQYCGLAD